MKRERRIRSNTDLHQTLTMICNTIWRGGKPPAGVHVWSIPVDYERDFDCILGDGLAELEARRYAMDKAGLVLGDEWKSLGIVSPWIDVARTMPREYSEEMRRAINYVSSVCDVDRERATQCADLATEYSIRHTLTAPDVLHLIADVSLASRRPISDVLPRLEWACRLADSGQSFTEIVTLTATLVRLNVNP